MKVILSRDAFADLDSIAGWIAQDDPNTAERFADDLGDRCASLSSHPKRFPIVRTIDGIAVRKLTQRGYLIFYRIDSERVTILRIIHGSRDWSALFDDGE